MKNTDTRVRYTKDILKKSLLELLKNKKIDKITVKELCEKAQINRGTFYLHYSAPNDLLYEIEKDFMANHSELFTDYMTKASLHQNDRGMDKLQALFQVTSENIELCKIIFGPNGDYRFQEKIKKQMKQETIRHWSVEFPEYKIEHLEYIFDYVFSGSMSLIFNWINDNDEQKITVEQLANRLDRLGHYAHLAIKEFN